MKSLNSSKKSPNRDAIFKHIKDEISGDAVPGIRLLCPTRWTVRAEAFSSISENYRALVSVVLGCCQRGYKGQ